MHRHLPLPRAEPARQALANPELSRPTTPDAVRARRPAEPLRTAAEPEVDAHPIRAPLRPAASLSGAPEPRPLGAGGLPLAQKAPGEPHRIPGTSPKGTEKPSAGVESVQRGNLERPKPAPNSLQATPKRAGAPQTAFPETGSQVNPNRASMLERRTNGFPASSEKASLKGGAPRGTLSVTQTYGKAERASC